MLKSVLSAFFGVLNRHRSTPPVDLDILQERCTFPERGVCRTECWECLPPDHIRFDTMTAGTVEGSVLTKDDFHHLPEGDWLVYRVVKLNFGQLLYYQIEIGPVPNATDEDVIHTLDVINRIEEAHGAA